MGALVKYSIYAQMYVIINSTFRLNTKQIRYNLGSTQQQGFIIHNWSVWVFISCVLTEYRKSPTYCKQ